MNMFNEEHTEKFISVDEVRRIPYPEKREDYPKMNREVIRKVWIMSYNFIWGDVDRYLEYYELFEDGLIPERNRALYLSAVADLRQLNEIHEATIKIYDKDIETLESRIQELERELEEAVL